MGKGKEFIGLFETFSEITEHKEASAYFDSKTELNEAPIIASAMAEMFLYLFVIKTRPYQWDIGTADKFNLDPEHKGRIFVPVQMPESVVNAISIFIKTFPDTGQEVTKELFMQELVNNLIEAGLHHYADSDRRKKMLEGIVERLTASS